MRCEPGTHDYRKWVLEPHGSFTFPFRVRSCNKCGKLQREYCGTKSPASAMFETGLNDD